jgi:predicted nicotinamide N-methyase
MQETKEYKVTGHPDDDHNDTEDPNLRVHSLLHRGAWLRQLRQFAQMDEESRQQQQQQQQDDVSDGITLLSNGMKILDYNHFLQTQPYYDDLKHINCHFIDYGRMDDDIRCNCSSILIEQDKSLGKGGWCWDAAFILAEYFLALTKSQNDLSSQILELGSGTGLCGILVARCMPSAQVIISDLPNLLPLMQRNIQRNYCESYICEPFLREYQTNKYGRQKPEFPQSQNVRAMVLDWEDTLLLQEQGNTFDVILGADVVASLYDPVALARTIHKLCNASSVVYISFKERLSEIHRKFEMEMKRIFDEMEIIVPRIRDKVDGKILWQSRNRNPDIRVLIARKKGEFLNQSW